MLLLWLGTVKSLDEKILGNGCGTENFCGNSPPLLPNTTSNWSGGLLINLQEFTKIRPKCLVISDRPTVRGADPLKIECIQQGKGTFHLCSVPVHETGRLLKMTSIQQ
jgi:hypothetical protein